MPTLRPRKLPQVEDLPQALGPLARLSKVTKREPATSKTVGKEKPTPSGVSNSSARTTKANGKQGSGTTASAEAASDARPAAFGERIAESVLRLPLLEGKGKTSLFEQLKGSDEGGLIVFVFPQASEHEHDDDDEDENHDFIFSLEIRYSLDYENTCMSMVGICPGTPAKVSQYSNQLGFKSLPLLCDNRAKLLKRLGIDITNKSRRNQGAIFALRKDGTVVAWRVGRQDRILDQFDKDTTLLDFGDARNA